MSWKHWVHKLIQKWRWIRSSLRCQMILMGSFWVSIWRKSHPYCHLSYSICCKELAEDLFTSKGTVEPNVMVGERTCASRFKSNKGKNNGKQNGSKFRAALGVGKNIVSLFRIKLPSYRICFAITNKLLDYVLCLDLSIECKMNDPKTIRRDIWRFLR